MDAIKPKFDPNLNYNWETETEFPMDGKTFEILFNYYQAKVNSKEVQDALFIFEAHKRLSQMFLSGVESGKVVPVEETKTPNQEVHTN